MEERAYRNRVSWMMFLLSILVIWVHSYNVELFAGGLWGPSWESAAWLEDFLSVTVGQIAVPGFFLLSSCLFFRNFTWEKLASKWKRRFFSVAVPYGVWNLLYYFGYVTATRLPFIQTVAGKEPVLFGPAEMLNAVVHYAYAPIFWYLFQLILLIFLSPAIYLLMKRRGVGLLCLAGMAAAIHFHLDTSHPNTDALFYFVCGLHDTPPQGGGGGNRKEERDAGKEAVSGSKWERNACRNRKKPGGGRNEKPGGWGHWNAGSGILPLESAGPGSGCAVDGGRPASGAGGSLVFAGRNPASGCQAMDASEHVFIWNSLYYCAVH